VTRVRAAAAALAAVLVAGCGAAAAAPTVAGLPPCSDSTAQPVDGAEVEAIEGLALPDDAVVTSVTEQGPQRVVLAEVARTPVEVRAAYEDGGWEVLSAEDEGFEAEILYRLGDRRGYVRANAVCDRGSSLLVVVAPESAAASLRAPRGGGAG